jgi:hypothetical protein
MRAGLSAAAFVEANECTDGLQDVAEQQQSSKATEGHAKRPFARQIAVRAIPHFNPAYILPIFSPACPRSIIAAVVRPRWSQSTCCCR